MAAKLSLLHSSFFCVCFLNFGIKCDTDYLLILERIEPVFGEHETLVDASKLKVIKKNGNYFFDGILEINHDIDDTLMSELVTSYSSLRNSQFVKLPFQLKRQSSCSLMKRIYETYLEVSFQSKSNFNGSECPIPKGTYFLREVALDFSKFPRQVPRGMLKIELVFYKDNNNVGGMDVFANVFDKN